MGPGAPEPPPASGEPSPSGRRWLAAGAVAAVVFLLLEWADGFIAVPLREISSVLTSAGLGAVGFPVTRHGTLLSTPNVRFDVVPACSGSTTLRVLLFVAIVWCGVHPKLTPLRRAFAASLAVPLALLANAARVAVLVVAGHLAGEEPGGVFHAGTGVAAFVAAMAGAFGLTELLATNRAQGPSTGRLAAVVQALLLAFLAAPFAYWCARGWGYVLDRHGWIFLVPAAAGAAWSWKRAPDDRSRETLGTVLFGGALLLLVAATLADVNIAKGVALLGVLLGLCLALKGPRHLRSMLPLAAVAYLGFPTTTYQLQRITVPLFGAGSAAAGFAAKAVLAVAFLALWLSPPFRPPGGPGPAPRRGAAAAWRLALLAVVAALQGVLYGAASGGVALGRLEMSYLQGAWEGRPYAVSTGDAFFDGRIWTRRYARGEEAVDVLVTSTGGDRHRAHPPAYCLTGDRWVAVREGRGETSVGGRATPMTRMTFRRDGREMAFAYWFTDGEVVEGGYRDMLAADALRRLTGRRTDWFLFRVMTEQGDAVLESFLGGFDATVIREPAR